MVLAGAGKTSELLGFRLGTTRIGGGGNCATAASAEKNKIADTMILALLALPRWGGFCFDVIAVASQTEAGGWGMTQKVLLREPTPILVA